jgi:predicted nucleotidyltransferase
MSPVRLSSEKIDTLKESILLIDPNAEVYLFGSRVALDKKGGDIDILILSKTLTLKEIRTIRLAFFKKFGEQKLDILLDIPSLAKAFTKTIKPKAVLL